jgi:hypothetical protein
VKTVATVDKDLVEEAVRPPGLRPEGDGHCFTEVVKLACGENKCNISIGI